MLIHSYISDEHRFLTAVLVLNLSLTISMSQLQAFLKFKISFLSHILHFFSYKLFTNLTYTHCKNVFPEKFTASFLMFFVVVKSEEDKRQSVILKLPGHIIPEIIYRYHVIIFHGSCFKLLCGFDNSFLPKLPDIQKYFLTRFMHRWLNVHFDILKIHSTSHLNCYVVFTP